MPTFDDLIEISDWSSVSADDQNIYTEVYDPETSSYILLEGLHYVNRVAIYRLKEK